MGVVIRLTSGKALAFRDADGYEVADKAGALSVVRWAPQGGSYSVGVVAAGTWEVVTVVHPSDEETMSAAVDALSDASRGGLLTLGSPPAAGYPPPPPPPGAAPTQAWQGPPSEYQQQAPPYPPG